MAKRLTETKVTIMGVAGILGFVGAWFALPALDDGYPVQDCVERALTAEGGAVAVSPQKYEVIKRSCEKNPGR